MNEEKMQTDKAMEKIQPGKTKIPALVIIDDEEAILMSLRSLFRREGYKIYCFSSPHKALEFLERHHADVIITDMRMPEMSGADLLEQSVKICPNAINIIISGYEEKSVILNAISRGFARHYIMKPWDDDQLKSLVSESMNLQQELRRKHLEEILLSFRNLPSLPKMHQRIKDILNQTPISQKEIVQEIEKSPALTAKLLRMSNSIYYGVRKPVSNIFDALTFVGMEEVLNIVLGLESYDCLCSQVPPDLLKSLEEMRINAVKCAQTAREISQDWKENTDPQEAYTAALMLDIGMVLRLCYCPEKFSKFYNIYKENDKPLYIIDKEIFTTPHDEVAEALLTYWNFSSGVISAVANHHSYASKDALTTIIQIASLLVHGKDSLPHDPVINEYADEWREKLSHILNN
ncbi:MAG: response regulator [Ignavibacteriaceae bacterium]